MAFGNTHLIFFNSATRHLLTHEQQDEQTRNNGGENVAECEQNVFHFGNPVSHTDYRSTTDRITAIFERLVWIGVPTHTDSRGGHKIPLKSVFKLRSYLLSPARLDGIGDRTV